MKKNRAQQEIVGFVLIVVIVIVIGLFLLVYYLRQPSINTQSAAVENFLQAANSLTTDCSIGIEPLDLQELIGSCYQNEKCSNEKMACEVLNETYSQMLRTSWDIGPDKPNTAYALKIYYEENQEKEDILELKEGNCTGSKNGAESFIHQGSGNITSSLEICYKS